MINFIIGSLLISALLLFILYILIDFIIVKYKKKTATMTFPELLGVLSAIIQLELDRYDKELFNNQRTITNSNFTNFYNDLTHNILNGISPEFMKQMQIYITEDMIVSYVARSVKEYLSTKVKGFL
jgi:tyrosine-protein phosphatase YwqE